MVNSGERLDGSEVAYAWFGEGARNVQVRVVADALGARPKVLLNDPEFVRAIPSGWAADGRSVLLLLQRADQSCLLAWISVGDGRLTPVKSLGWRLAGDTDRPRLSPDGRFIVYPALPTNPAAPPPRRFGRAPLTAAAAEKHLYLLAVDGSSEAVLVNQASVSEQPAWAPDGKTVLYLSNASGAVDLWSLSVEEGRPVGAPTLITRDIGRVATVGTSRTGDYVFARELSGVPQVTFADLRDGMPDAAIAAGTLIGSYARWSPDGASIAVMRKRPQSDDNLDLAVRSVRVGTERVYRRDAMSDAPALWMEHGRSLLKYARDAGEGAWYRLDVTSGQFTKLIDNRADPAVKTHWSIVTPSPDGRTIYFGAVANASRHYFDRVVAADVATGRYRTVVTLPGTPDHLPTNAAEFAIAASPDGRSLAVYTVDPSSDTGHVATVDVDGRNWRELCLPFQSDASVRDRLVWTSDGRWIIFPMTEPGRDESVRIMRVSSNGGAMEFTGVAVDDLDTIDASPDRSRLAFGTTQPMGARHELWRLALKKP